MQTVGLAQQIVEEEGIATVSITRLAGITRKIRPPRALSVPYPLGYPLGEPNNPDLQHEVLGALIALLERNDVPVLEEFNPTGHELRVKSQD